MAWLKKIEPPFYDQLAGPSVVKDPRFPYIRVQLFLQAKKKPPKKEKKKEKAQPTL